MKKILFILTFFVPLIISAQDVIINMDHVDADLLNGQASTYYLDTTSTAQTKSGQLTLSDSLIMSRLATSNTTVATFTATGNIDSLETVDITEVTHDTLSADFVDVTNDLDVGDTIEFDNGAKFYNTHADTVYIEETVVKIEGDLHVTGAITVDGVRLGAYVPVDSTLTTELGVDTWTFLGDGENSKFVNIHSSDHFDFCGDTLCYIGTPTIYLYIEYGGTTQVDTPAESMHCTIFINDTEAEQFTGVTFCKTADEQYPIAGISNIVQVSTNDKIKIMVKSLSATTNICDYFSISAHKIH